jgi:hypothetical protein
MSTTLDNITWALDQVNVQHFPDPGNDATLIPFGSPEGPILVVLRLDCEGNYLRLMSRFDNGCAANPEALALMAKLNYDNRLVKIGRDEDNDVLLDAGIWVMDGRLTPTMLERMLMNFVGVATEAFGQLRAVLRQAA